MYLSFNVLMIPSIYDISGKCILKKQSLFYIFRDMNDLPKRQ